MNTFMRIRLQSLWAILFFILVGCTALRADENGIRVKAVEAYPTFESIGLRLAYEGDADSNATASVSYRLKGAGRWRQAQPLGRIKGSRFAGSVFFLNPGTRYEVKITVADPASVNDVEQEDRIIPVTTRSERFPTGGGREYYVDPAGDDANPGTSLAKPLRTIQRAADLVRPGSVVRILPGSYHEQVQLTTSGQKDKYIAFIARGKGVILSGADPSYDSPYGTERWRSEIESDVYYTYPGYKTSYVGARGQRLYHYETREEFDTFICGSPGGWYQDEATSRLYVRLSTAEDPSAVMMQVAALNTGFHLEGADYVLIEGLEIRDYGTGPVGMGIHLDRSSWCVIRGNSIHGMRAKVQLSGTSAAEGNLIENNHIWDTLQPHWPWPMTKGHCEEGGGVMSDGGRGTVVRGNYMHGLFDGLVPSPSNWDDIWDETYNCDWDVYDNEIYDISDDIMEPEGPCINFRIWNNYCHDMLVGISLAPINVGPTYVLYNVVYNTTLKSFKFGSSGPGLCYLYHNSIYGNYQQHRVIDLSRSLEGQTYRNNIFYGTDFAFNIRKIPQANNDIDYNAWYASDPLWFYSYTGTPHQRLFFYMGEYWYSIEQLRENLGWEEYGLAADPGFLLPDQGDLRLEDGSPCIDRGVALPNINDGFLGEAPDLGAYEWGAASSGLFPLGRRP